MLLVFCPEEQNKVFEPRKYKKFSHQGFKELPCDKQTTEGMTLTYEAVKYFSKGSCLFRDWNHSVDEPNAKVISRFL